MKLLSAIGAVLMSVSAFGQDLVEYDNAALTQNCTDLMGNQIRDVIQLDNDDFAFLTDNFKLTKVDSNFDTIWHNSQLDTTGNRLDKIKATFDGGFIGVGGGPSGQLFKLDAFGDTTWAKPVQVFNGPFGGFGIRDVIQTSDSGFAFIAIYGHMFANSIIVKTDNDGDTLWVRKNIFPGIISSDKQARTISEANNEDLIISGSIKLGPPTYSELSFLYRLDSNGDSLWAKTYADLEFNALEIDGNQDFIIAGEGKNSTNTAEPLIIKINSLGDTLWTKTVAAESINNVTLVNGGYAFVGSKEPVASFISSFLYRTDNNGDSLWSKVYPADTTDREQEMIFVLSNKDYLMVGNKFSTQSFSPYRTMDYRIHVDSLGICRSVGVEEIKYNSIALSPNPNLGYFSVKVDYENIGSTYRIYDSLGRAVDSGILSEKSQVIDLLDKPKGLYILRVTNGKAFETLRVIVK